MCDLINVLKKLSFTGRVIYGVKCFENFLIKFNFDTIVWRKLIYILWDFSVDMEEYTTRIGILLVDKEDNYSDLIKTNNYKNFTKMCLNDIFLTEEEYYYFLELYNKIIYDNNYDKFFEMLEYIWYLSNMITNIVEEYDEDTIYYLEDIIKFMKENNIDLPNINIFQKFYIVNNNILGIRRNYSYLSEIL